jgi:hypothetical protein
MAEPGGDYERGMKTTFFPIIAALLVFGVSTAHSAAPFKKISGDRLLHISAKVIFPAKIGLFSRDITQLYDSTGRDVSVRYVLDHLILSDVYSYPVGPRRAELTSEFKNQQDGIRQLNKNVKLLSQRRVRTNQNGRAIIGLHADYELQRDLFGQRNRKCGSQLFVFQDGDWFVAYRFSYPREHSEIAHKHIDDFLRQWKWRER